MRRLASFLLLGFALAASGATEVWRWKDADGVVHYSDSPVPGAERVSVGPATRPNGASVTPPPAYSGTPAPEPESSVRYARCAVTVPAKDEVYFSVDAVDVSVALEPALQPGHYVQVWMNGGVYGAWPETATAYRLTGLYRGSYTLAVKVVDGTGRVLCAGPAAVFHIRQPSALSPARQPPKKK